MESCVGGRLDGRKLLLLLVMVSIILLEEGLKMGAGKRLQIRCCEEHLICNLGGWYGT